jgi:UDP-N-acetylmuramyl pentapeptide synthase
MKGNSMFRQLLKWSLSILSSWAIRKHRIKLIVILGIGGSDIVKEILYTVLKEKMNVRRNIADIWWDLSIPLNVLGYDDKQRSSIQWVNLLLSAFVALIKNKSNPQGLIINADTSKKATVDYWSKFVRPDYLVVLNYDEKSLLTNRLLTQINTTKGKIIINEKLISRVKKKIDFDDDKYFSYGQNKADLKIKSLSDGKLKIKYKKEKVILPKKIWISISENISGALFAVAILEKFTLKSIAYSFLKYSFPKSMISRIKTNLSNSAINV